MMKRGILITVEGGEGAGKTSVLKELHKALQNLGYDVIATREPGGSMIAEQIRSVILNENNTAMDRHTEALLYAAARRQHLVERVIPALEQGKIILCDRFIDSSLAYQGYARGIGIDQVLSINRFAIGDYFPDLTLFFDVCPEVGLARIANDKGREINRLDKETIHFHQKVREGFLEVQKRYQERIKVIDANQSFEQVVQESIDIVTSYLTTLE